MGGGFTGPLSSDALSSKTVLPFSNFSPNNSDAKHKILVVLPVPGGPLMIRLGIFPFLAMTRSLAMVCSFPTTWSNTLGRYFSSHGCSMVILLPVFGGVVEEGGVD